jgi:hypothetical protein
MVKKIINKGLLVLFSVGISLLIFISLTYTSLLTKIVNVLMKITGYDFYQGETRVGYVFNFVLGIFLFIFMGVLLLSNRYLFRARKPK